MRFGLAGPMNALVESAPNRIVPVGTARFGNDLPLALIAGPCALESRNHALETAGALKEITGRLGIGLVYKTWFDKANRTSAKSARGVGLADALPIFAKFASGSELHSSPMCTRQHNASPFPPSWMCCRIPAFLCRQTDLLAAAARPVASLM